MMSLAKLRTSLLCAAACLAALAAGCAGGSGSSGFNIAESLVLDRVTQDGECEEFEGLVICAADTAPALDATPTATAEAQPSDTPIASPTDAIDFPTPGVTATVPQPPASATPDGTAGPSATATPSGMPSVPTVVATATSTRTPPPTATPTPTSEPSLGVVTNVAGLEDTPNCVAGADSGTCAVPFEFAATGFPAGAAFRIASRLADQSSPWDIQTPTTLVSAANTALLGVGIPVELNDAGSNLGVVPMLQLVVLAYETDPGPLPDRVDSLSETGADIAFAVPTFAVIVN